MYIRLLIKINLKAGSVMLKTKSFSKLFSIWFGTPMYWFPDNSDVEYKNLNTDFYHNSNTYISHYKSKPIYVQIKKNFYERAIFGYCQPVDAEFESAHQFIIRTDELFDELSTKTQHYILEHEKAHAITKERVEENPSFKNHVAFECHIDNCTGLSKEEIILAIDDIISYLKNSKDKKYLKNQIKFFKAKKKYHETH